MGTLDRPYAHSHSEDTEDAMQIPSVPFAGLDTTLGLQVRTDAGRVSGELTVAAQPLDRAGRLHHGVLSAMVETIASLAAALAVGPERRVVGTANSTDVFGDAAMGDVLQGQASSVHAPDGADHVWHVEIRGARGLVAVGRVRLTAASEWPHVPKG